MATKSRVKGSGKFKKTDRPRTDRKTKPTAAKARTAAKRTTKPKSDRKTTVKPKAGAGLRKAPKKPTSHRTSKISKGKPKIASKAKAYGTRTKKSVGSVTNRKSK